MLFSILVYISKILHYNNKKEAMMHWPLCFAHFCTTALILCSGVWQMLSFQNTLIALLVYFAIVYPYFGA